MCFDSNYTYKTFFAWFDMRATNISINQHNFYNVYILSGQSSDAHKSLAWSCVIIEAKAGSSAGSREQGDHYMCMIVVSHELYCILNCVVISVWSSINEVWYNTVQGVICSRKLCSSLAALHMARCYSPDAQNCKVRLTWLFTKYNFADAHLI